MLPGGGGRFYLGVHREPPSEFLQQHGYGYFVVSGYTAAALQVAQDVITKKVIRWVTGG